MAGPWLTVANAITSVRLLSVVPIAVAIARSWWPFAGAVFCIAVLTDIFDGKVARRRGETSTLGGLIDHGTDALFVVVALGALSIDGPVTYLLPMLVALAFVQYTLDSRALSGHKLRSSWLGRNNGIMYYVCVGVPVVRNALDLRWPSDAVITVFAWILVITTMVSIVDRANTWLRLRQHQPNE